MRRLRWWQWVVLALIVAGILLVVLAPSGEPISDAAAGAEAWQEASSGVRLATGRHYLEAWQARGLELAGIDAADMQACIDANLGDGGILETAAECAQIHLAAP